jgi:hypothetical protein
VYYPRSEMANDKRQRGDRFIVFKVKKNMKYNDDYEQG